MTEDNIIGIFDHTPNLVEQRNINMIYGTEDMGDQIASQMGRFRPTPELSSYRMPVKNMYYSSAGAHDGAGVRGACGYVCYKVIAKDFGLRKIWEEKGRPF
jgi:phytoene dehydrogenase-like protein